jgi:adenine phosphoribosyltransferase
MSLLADKIKSLIRDVPDFPKPGILFKDITPLLAHPDVRAEMARTIAQRFKSESVEAVVAIEARGFILGSLIAHEMAVPFVPVRKSGKLPYATFKQSYDLEYGAAAVEIHADALHHHKRVLVHDDLLATGGTAQAAGQLVQTAGGTVCGFSFIINLAFLPGEQQLKKSFAVSPFSLVSYP